MYYRQCVLNRNGVGTTTWLPEEFAVKGKIVKLRKRRERTSWSDGWEVRVVGSVRLDPDQIKQQEYGYLHHREETDI